MARSENHKRNVLLRLKRIEGQVRGIQKMVENDLPCADILTQVAAATAAMKRVGRTAVQVYLGECLGTRPGRETARLEDLRSVISRYIDWA